jgi:excisionase family DNA binding protein
MKSRPTQFCVRENTASSRRHASRLEEDVNAGSNLICIEEENSETPIPSHLNSPPVAGLEDMQNATPRRAATGGEGWHANHLLTVQEVAELLQVPASWVYERVRKRSLERLPGYRLGKYWRFREAEVLTWVERHRAGARSNA